MKLTITTIVNIDEQTAVSTKEIGGCLPILSTNPPPEEEKICLPANPTEGGNHTLKYLPNETPKLRWVKD